MINFELMDLLNKYGITAEFEKIPSLFRVGCGLDSESTTITHTETDKKGKEKTIVDYCFNYVWQWAFAKEKAFTVRTLGGIMNELENIIQTVKAYNVSHETNAIFIIWCANLSHEWSFIKSAITNRFEVTKCFAKTPREPLYIQLEKYVELRECIGLFGHSLDDIAKNWCSSDNQKLKGTYDYNKIRTFITPLNNETEQPYIYHDVTTLAEMHMKVIETYTQDNGVCRLPYTSSGFVRLALKDSIRNDEDITELREIYNETHTKKPLKTNIEYLKKQNERCVVDSFQWFICREYGYSGGLCGSNIEHVGKILNDVVCADLTSDYPAQLTHKLYPCGSIKQITDGNLNDIRKAYDKMHKPYFALLKIKSMKAKTKHATFSEHKIINKDDKVFTIHGKPRNMIIYNGKVWRGTNLIVCWNDVDIAAYKKMYDIKAATITLWVFDSYKKLPEWFLKTLWNGYRRKAELKNLGLSDTIEYTDSKRIPNSIYGVCAQKVTDVYDEIGADNNFKVKREKNFDEMRKDFWLNPYIAFWCTSYARKILIDFLSEYPESIVQYDTDSLYYIKSKGKDLEKALLKYNEDITIKNRRIFKDEENPTLFETLGQWDFDDIYKKFLGMGAKKYIKQDSKGKIKTVIAGLPKNAIPKEIEATGEKAPFNYYNPLVKWLKTEDNKIIIKHMFANKFASVYNDDTIRKDILITDVLGNTTLQEIGCYHAIIPIDFTLSMKVDYLKHIVKGR